MTQLFGASSRTAKGHGFNLQSEHIPKLWFNPPSGCVPEATDQCSTLSVSLSFPLSLNPIKACPWVRNKRKIFKYFFCYNIFWKEIFLELIYVLNILSCLLCTYWMTFKFPNPFLHLYNLSLVLLIVKCWLWALPLEDVI